MNEKNGVSGAYRHIDETWEIVEAGPGAKYIGKVADDTQGMVTLKPAFLYLGGPQLTPAPNGQGVAFNYQRFVFPIELMASFPPIRVRALVRMRLFDFDKYDRDVFESAINEAFANVTKLAAGRAGLTLATTMPKDARRP